MIVIVNNGGKLSVKAKFIVQLFKERYDAPIFYITRRKDLQFAEKWDKDKVELAITNWGYFIYILLMVFKSPKDLRDGLMVRFLGKYRTHELVNKGLISALSKTLHQYFVVPSKTKNLKAFLNNNKSPKVFLIDEFVSTNLVDLKILKSIGPLLYVSQDLACDNFSYSHNFLTRNLIDNFERKALGLSDIVIACSERDRLKYIEMGARKTLFYPNIYPTNVFDMDTKETEPSISIVLRGHWGKEVDKSIEDLFNALSRIKTKIRVNVIGIKPQFVPKNVNLFHYEFISNKVEYLTILSKSWIGINIGIHLGGTNERKYDYAMSGLVVFSDQLGCRGDLLPHEFTYVDSQDLTAKLGQILEQGRKIISEMGLRNRNYALRFAEQQRQNLLIEMNKLSLNES